jgi:two-component system, cell cycle response regulator
MKILIAEDDRLTRRVLTQALEALSFDVTAMTNGLDAWEYLRANEIQVVISDWMMPGLDGLELCRRVRSRGAEGPYVYLILLTARDSRDDRLEGLQAGADAFLTKPFDRAELFARLNVARRIINVENQLRRRAADLERMHSEMEKRNALLAEIASCDGLSGLKNHGFFRDALDVQIRVARHQGMPLSMVMIDVDHFKSFNDSFGHPAGNDVLCEVADILRSCVRSNDLVARYGGEEFAVLLSSTDVETSLAFGERIRLAIEQHPWRHRPITISLGISTMDTQLPMAAVLLDQADRALYRSKALGRNRLTHARDLSDDHRDRRAPLSLDTNLREDDGCASGGIVPSIA